MAEPGVERKLTAILAGDGVGCSRLMTAEEGGTLARPRILSGDFIDRQATAGAS